MATNPFDQFDAPTVNPFDQFDAKSVQTGTGLPGPRRTYSLSEVPGQAITNIPESARKFGAGVYEAVTHPVQTAKSAWDIAAGALQKVLPDDAVKFVNQFEGNPVAAARAIEAANAVGGLYKERYGSFDNIKRTLAEDPVGAAADLSTLLTGGAMATAKVAPGVSQALTTAATATNPLSVVTKPAQTILAAKEKILPSAILKEREANAVRDATLQAGQAEGYIATPGVVAPSAKNILAERIAGKTHLEQLASVQNQAVTDRLARRAAGISDTAPLTSDNTRQIRADEYAKGYVPIEKLGEIKTDPAFLNDLIAVESHYAGPNASFPGAIPDTVSKLLKDFTVDKFAAKDAVEVTRSLRDQAKADFKHGDNATAKARLAISNALENQIERFLVNSDRSDAANILEQFRLSRQRIAISHTIEDAIKEGGGSVIAQKLAKDIQSGKYVSGDIKTIAEFANVFPRVTQTPSQIGAPGAGTILGRSLSGLAGGIAGFKMAGPEGAGYGAAMGAAAPELMSAAVRNYLLSSAGQRNILPQYTPLSSRLLSDEAARNLLLMEQANQNALAR